LLQEVNVVLSLTRQLVEVANVRNVALPTRKSLVHRLCVIEDALVLWDGLVNLAVALISNAYLNLIQAAKNVKLGNCQVSETIDASRVVNNYCVVPAAAALTTGSNAILMANFAEMNEVYAEFFSQPFPARSAVAVKALPKGALVEVECIAAK